MLHAAVPPEDLHRDVGIKVNTPKMFVSAPSGGMPDSATSLRTSRRRPLRGGPQDLRNGRPLQHSRLHPEWQRGQGGNPLRVLGQVGRWRLGAHQRHQVSWLTILVWPVANLIKQFTSIIYDSRVVLTTNLPICDSKVVIYNRTMFIRLATVAQSFPNVGKNVTASGLTFIAPKSN